MNGQVFELKDGGGDDIPVELDQALLDYFNISESEDGDYGIGGTIIDLIYDGRVGDWSHFFANKVCSKGQSLSYTKKEGLTEKQELFVRALYHWIVYFSDIVQFLNIDDKERIIIDYIKRRFPGSNRRGAFTARVQQITG